jgi:hypothetical protein
VLIIYLKVGVSSFEPSSVAVLENRFLAEFASLSYQQSHITSWMDSQGSFGIGANVSLLALDATAPVSAVSSAIQANDAHRAALNARRALIKKQIEDGDIMLDNMDKFVDPALEEVRVKNLDEWAIFAIGATAVRPLLTNKQLNADVRMPP